MSATPMIVRADEVPPQPWKNGGGVTRELLTWPSRGDWSVRISVADIAQDGPFSAFPGVTRWFVVLKGDGVMLKFADGVEHRLRRVDAPLQFDGASAPTCSLLDGPTRDLNLMLRGAAGHLVVVEDGARWLPQSAACGLFTAVGGRCSFGVDSDAVQTEVELPAYTLLWFDAAPACLSFSAAARPATAMGWWIAASPEPDQTEETCR